MLAALVFTATFALGVSVFLYIMVMGPSAYHRNGVIGKIYEMIIRTPFICGGACFSLFCCCDQQKGREAYTRWWDRTFKYRKWSFVVLYVSLVWSIEYVYLFHALHELKASVWSKGVSWLLVLVSEVFYALAVFSNPGKVTLRKELEKHAEYLSHDKKTPSARRKRPSVSLKRPKDSGANYSRSLGKTRDNTEELSCQKWNCSSSQDEEEYVLNNHYAFDGIIYPASGYYGLAKYAVFEKKLFNDSETLTSTGLTCFTCRVPRPSRSKHCRYCNICVRRFDHHCPWINNDVAEGTHRYFMAFLLMHTISCIWAFSDLFRCIKQFLLLNDAWGWKLKLNHNHVISLGINDYARLLIFLQPRNLFLIFFAAVMAIFLYSFFIYNLRFVVQNVTINDLNKMEDLAEAVSELPTLDLVYQEAMQYCQRLEKVALRKPRALYKLPKPPCKSDPGYEEGGKQNKKYRNNVQKILLRDLRGLFDRGVWNNLKEVFFPYSVLSKPRVKVEEEAIVSSP